jgi:hypothetical protein
LKFHNCCAAKKHKLKKITKERAENRATAPVNRFDWPEFAAFGFVLVGIVNFFYGKVLMEFPLVNSNNFPHSRPKIIELQR